jgi:DNA uptake protein ComE-like DNA-binding protein
VTSQSIIVGYDFKGEQVSSEAAPLYTEAVISELYSSKSEVLAGEVSLLPYSEPLSEAQRMEIPDVGSVSINLSTKFELERVPGIGPHGAQIIIDNRPYESLEELYRLPGIRPKNLERSLVYLKL